MPSGGRPRVRRRIGLAPQELGIYPVVSVCNNLLPFGRLGNARDPVTDRRGRRSAFGMAVTAVARTMQQLNAIGSVGGFAMAMFGGAFVPVSPMPGWAQAIAPVMPTYWAMKGEGSGRWFLRVGGLGDVVVLLLVMVGFGVLFTLLAAAKFRLEDHEAYYG